jgi:type IV pilus assembly protein PilW
MGNAIRNMGKSKSLAGRLSKTGFSLIEVMSAMVILGIAMTAAYATFQLQHGSFTVQNRVAETQQSLRSVLEIMSRDIRLSGYGIPAQVKLPDGMLPSGDNAIRNVIPLNRTTGTDEIYILYMYDMDASRPPSTTTGGMASDASVLNVASTAGFAKGDLILISNGITSDMFEVTQVVSPTLVHDVGGSVNLFNSAAAHTFWPGGGYGNGDTVSMARFVRYFIDDVTDPDHPTLMLDRMTGVAQPLADDIEDMQIQYGLDTDADFVVDTWVNSPTAAQRPLAKQVRLFLSARTRMTERGWQDTGRPALADRAAGGPDGYRRRIVNGIVIDLRNPG